MRRDAGIVAGMSYRATVGHTVYGFADLRELMGKASPARSGDQLAGVGARTAQERVAAQSALADVPLATFLSEAVVPYEDDEVTRLILDTHDAAAFAPVSHLTVGGLRDWLLSDAATGASVHPLDAVRLDLRSSPQIVVVVRVPPIDDHVTLVEERHEVLEHGIDHPCRHHQPDRPWSREPTHERGQVGRSRRTFGDERSHRVRIVVGDNQVVTSGHEAFCHARAHPPKPDHAQLHRSVL